MATPRISMIAAIGQNRELGRKNELIWRIRDDLRRVKELTTGHPIIMGRKTHESIGKPLPNRTNIVISRTAGEISGCVVVESLDESLTYAKTIEEEELFIFGGASVYAAALPFTDRLYLTKIEASNTEADAFFPDYSAFTKILDSEKREQDGLSYTWVTLERED